jgi:hypothetical protein
LTFTIDQGDYRSAWEAAMRVCFNGGTVTDPDGNARKLAPRAWTVKHLKEEVAPEAEPDPTNDEAERSLAPSPELLDPDVRERELARLYAGRQYDDIRVRKRRHRRHATALTMPEQPNRRRPPESPAATRTAV